MRMATLWSGPDHVVRRTEGAGHPGLVSLGWLWHRLVAPSAGRSRELTIGEGRARWIGRLAGCWRLPPANKPRTCHRERHLEKLAGKDPIKPRRALPPSAFRRRIKRYL